MSSERLILPGNEMNTCTSISNSDKYKRQSYIEPYFKPRKLIGQAKMPKTALSKITS